MASMSWVLRLPFVIILTVLFAYSIRGQRGTQSGLRRLLESLQTSASPAVFSSTTDCTKWLRQNPASIVYNYGVNDTLSGAGALRDCLLRDEATQARQKIQEILIALPLFSQPGAEQQPLQELLQILPNLESLRCNGHYHACRSLNRQLSKNNNSWSTYFSYDMGNKVIPFIECSSNSLVYDGGESDERLDQLYHALVACPNIQSLSLSLSQGSCIIGDTRRSFSWKKGDRFPALENLTLSGYDWDFRVNSREPSNAEHWKASMDWSKLKRLDFSLPSNSFLETFRDELGGLESLVLRHRLGFWGDEETLCAFDATAEELRQNYTSFIAALLPLHELSISGVGQPLNMTPILETHGASLEKLNIHEFEHDCRYATGNATWVRPVLGVSEVEEIIVSAPNLKELTLDVYRSSNKWPNSMLKALSKFPHLARLTIYFDLEDPGRTRYAERCLVNEWVHGQYCTIHELMEPQLNHTTASEIFHTIRQYQAGTKLQNVTFFAGNFGRQEGGGLRIDPHYEWNKPARYDCWMEEDIIKCTGQHDIDLDDEDFLL
ncbi:hypothetical protein BGW36DRAFT_307061 [Talaromyces proteolyticus]|uniref:F-box domain-containing protein n=1 Tax=Talaromyces proteolyticus TaxID=1131652 RepID=A0AAD4KEP5_9EURO|nr:uncharacterized protein BGW36DRAFT_307061 [Talaromyces proteolyticus]KAH8689894.1 hypothetical protein BGW36DRAFT_307061 [Talaromyces proteolyticus]